MAFLRSVTLHFDDGDEQAITGDNVATRASAVLELYAIRDEEASVEPRKLEVVTSDKTPMKNTQPRKHDWADREAERLYQTVSSIALNAISSALRQAARNDSLDEALNSGDGTYKP